MAYQLKSQKDSVVVIGGANMDIGGRPSAKLTLKDSIPGTVQMTPGGVGRNVAHNLRLLGMDVAFVTSLGDDLVGQTLLRSCEELGIDMRFSIIQEGARSSAYLFLTDADGDMYAAINDMDICRILTPAFFISLMPKIKSYSAMFLDTNLPAESISWLVGHARMPIYADTVSCAKAERLRPHLKRIRALKTNALEAAVLTGESDPERAALKLTNLCPGRIFVSLGSNGMIAAERNKLFRFPVYETEIISSTGAGDAAAAAIVWSDRKGYDLSACAQLAQLAGSITCRSSSANNPDLSTLPNLI